MSEVKTDYTFEYMSLSRCEMDCNTYIQQKGFKWGHNYFWGGKTVSEHIATMRKIYNKLPVKPMWMHPYKITKYENEMLDIEYANSIKTEDEPNAKYCEECECVH